jgi:hypothetical protein
MKTIKILTILTVALGLIVCLPMFSNAAPMGTAFTYQGSLIDSNSVADGLYDFQFKLFGFPLAGPQQGSTIDVNELDVIDGHFAVELDFGSDVFDGAARWLEITVAHGDGSDPCTLSPRQELTPTPYALYAASANSVAVPLTLSGSEHGSHVIKGSNFSDGLGSIGVLGEATGASGLNYGGFFEAAGNWGRGVYGEASGTGAANNYGGFFEAAGGNGVGVYGEASDTGTVNNYGGFFEAAGSNGRGVYGRASGTSAQAVHA